MHNKLRRKVVLSRQQLLDDLSAIPPGVSAAELNTQIGSAVMRVVKAQWEQDTQPEGRQACYLSMEYLIGRMVFANLMNLCVLREEPCGHGEQLHLRHERERSCGTSK
jgi:glucan phosphorylase